MHHKSKDTLKFYLFSESIRNSHSKSPLLFSAYCRCNKQENCKLYCLLCYKWVETHKSGLKLFKYHCWQHRKLFFLRRYEDCKAIILLDWQFILNVKINTFRVFLLFRRYIHKNQVAFSFDKVLIFLCKNLKISRPFDK